MRALHPNGVARGLLEKYGVVKRFRRNCSTPAYEATWAHCYASNKEGPESPRKDQDSQEEAEKTQDMPTILVPSCPDDRQRLMQLCRGIQPVHDLAADRGKSR